MINLHHGSIVIQSAKWKGSTFTISLPIGRSYLSATEIATEKSMLIPTYEDIKIYTSDIQPVSFHEEVPVNRQKEHSILVIEDNDDLPLFSKAAAGQSL